MSISNAGVSIEELRILLSDNYETLRCGEDYVLAESMDEDEEGNMVGKKDAYIESWLTSEFPCPDEEDIEQLLSSS